MVISNIGRNSDQNSPNHFFYVRQSQAQIFNTSFHKTCQCFSLIAHTYTSLIRRHVLENILVQEMSKTRELWRKIGCSYPMGDWVLLCAVARLPLETRSDWGYCRWQDIVTAHLFGKIWNPELAFQTSETMKSSLQPCQICFGFYEFLPSIWSSLT
jgi:hypothetical protein